MAFNDLLPSWNEGPTRTAILAFIAATTGRGPAHVPAAERVAVFDGDGTLWPERPLPVRLHFGIRMWATAARENPELAEQEPFRAARDRDFEWFAAALAGPDSAANDDLRVVEKAVRDLARGRRVGGLGPEVETFVASGVHPHFARRYRDLAYVPMQELMQLLVSHDFTVLIASTGARDLIRTYAGRLYEIDPEQVVGNTFAMRFVTDQRGGDLEYDEGYSYFEAPEKKPIEVWKRLGRRPILTCGNDDNDAALLQFSNRSRPSLSLVIKHDDPIREFAYDDHTERISALATTLRWTEVSIRDDWRTIFAPES